MLANALLILSDFALIALGLLLRRLWPETFHRGFWTGAENLVYYVLFPALLFNSIHRAPLSFATEATAIAVAVGALLGAILLGMAARRLLRPAPEIYASCAQTAFRFNSYIGLALAQSLLGARGVALLALVIGVCVPIANAVAVYALARHAQRGLLRELVRNPMILATVAGLAANLLGAKLPEFLTSSLLDRLGGGGLALGLLCIGAGLRLEETAVPKRAVAYFSAVKLLAFPAFAAALAWIGGLRGVEAKLLVLFGALPTASTAYVLAARMGGAAEPVAFTITLQTLLAVLTIPLWIALVNW